MYHIDEENSDIIFEVNGKTVAFKIREGTSGESGPNIYLIKEDDPTSPSDKNAYSALRTLDEISERSLSKVYDDEAAGHIKFNKGITVYSPLSANELKKQSSDAVLETGENASDVISVNIVEEGNDPEILASGITEIATGVITVTTLGELDNVSEEVDSAPEGYILRKEGAIWIASPENITKGIVVDDTFGENNNPDHKQESISLITSEFGSSSASIGITSTGKPIIVNDYVPGYSCAYKELALMNQLHVYLNKSNTPLDEFNLALYTDSVVINNVSWAEIDVPTANLGILCREVSEEMDLLNHVLIYDESNADITDRFTSWYTAFDQMYYKCFNNETPVPIGKIKLIINTSN